MMCPASLIFFDLDLRLIEAAASTSALIRNSGVAFLCFHFSQINYITILMMETVGSRKFSSKEISSLMLFSIIRFCSQSQSLAGYI